jgi:signal transduction histidine kinase
MPNQYIKIRNSLVILVMLITFPSMVAIIFYALSEQRRDARLQAQETALRVARLSAREQERLITGAHHLLMSLAELPEVRQRKADRCSQLFAGILKKFPYYTNVAAVTPQGDIFCSGLTNHSSIPNIADREYFQEALKERRLGISHVLVGRMSGKPNITIAYPSFDPDGPVHAVVFVGLDLTWLNNIAATAQLPSQASLLAMDEKGSVFVRYPEQKEWAGTSDVNPSLVRTIIEQKEGFTEAEGPDGVRRLFGFTTLHHSSKSGALFVSVGIPTEVAFANSQRIFYDSLVVLLVAALLAAAGTWLSAHLLIRRRLEKLIATARAFGDGEYNEAPRSAAELAKTAGQFDQVINEMRIALQKASGRQADFAAMIAHDFRNALHTIHCGASLLPKPGQPKHNEQVFIDMIHHGCNELSQMLNEFLDFSKYKAGYLQLDKEEFDLCDLFGEVEVQYLWQTKQKKILLCVEVEPKIGSITADRKKLHQLLDNLLSNALKFTNPHGEIRIGARQVDGGMDLWVTDTGIGIAPTECNTLFSLYGQTASSRSSTEKGTGLGLLICKMIAEAHGGQISVESQVGVGTTFRVWLPRTATSYLATDMS